MSLTINILYTGKNGSAKKFAEAMVSSGLVYKVRAEEGNLRYEYYFPMQDEESVLLVDEWKNEEALNSHHKSPMMKEIANLREKYKLKMQVKKFQEIK